MKFPRQRCIFTAPLVSELTGIPQNTINSYFARGLLPVSVSTASKHGNARQYGADNIATLMLMDDLKSSFDQRPEFAAILADTCAAEFTRQMFQGGKKHPIFVVRLGGGSGDEDMDFADGLEAALEIGSAWEASARPFYLCIDLLKVWKRVVSALAERELEPLAPEDAVPSDYVPPTEQPSAILPGGKIDSKAIYARLNARKPGQS